MVTRPPAQLVLLACVSVLSLWPRSTVVVAKAVARMEQSKAARLALFEHVLVNDARWSPVLKQRIKLSELDLPQYRETPFNKSTVDRLRLVAKDVEEVTAMQVMQRLMDTSSWSGTNVDYTSYVLSTAFTCFTYTNVSFVLDLVNRIDGVVHDAKTLSDNHNSLDDLLDDVRMAFIVFVDKVTAMDGNLRLLIDGLYDYDSAAEFGDDLLRLTVLGLMEKDVKTTLDRYCQPVPDSEVYEYLSEYDYLNIFSRELDANATLAHVMGRYDKVIDCMLDVYDGLDVETMHMETWIQILQYKIPIRNQINFHTDNKMVVKDPSVGTKMLIEKKPVNLHSLRLDFAIVKTQELKNEQAKEEKKRKKKDKKKDKKKKKKKDDKSKESEESEETEGSEEKDKKKNKDETSQETDDSKQKKQKTKNKTKDKKSKKTEDTDEKKEEKKKKKDGKSEEKKEEKKKKKDGKSEEIECEEGKEGKKTKEVEEGNDKKEKKDESEEEKGNKDEEKKNKNKDEKKKKRKYKEE